MQTVSFFYALFLAFIIFFSYFFVDPNFPLQSTVVRNLVGIGQTPKMYLYITTVLTSFGLYVYFLGRIHAGKIVARDVWTIVFLNILLVLSYPAFSFDIFNYIATAKVAFLYGENPYIVMPIELSQEPLLAFMHAANKTALYGPSWILLTAIPLFAGLGNLFLTVFMFKMFNFLFYIGVSYLVFMLSKKEVFKLALFSLNPLVVIESLVSGHNDIVMVFFALLSFYLVRKKLFIFSLWAMIVSVFVKFATIVITPLLLYAIWQSAHDKTVDWDTIWRYSSLLLFIVFLASPLREEMYAWYFIWPFAFLVLSKHVRFIIFIAVFFSAGLLFRFTPFIYTREWGGITPLIKQVVTFGSVLMAFAGYPLFRKKYP